MFDPNMIINTKNPILVIIKDPLYKRIYYNAYNTVMLIPTLIKERKTITKILKNKGVVRVGWLLIDNRQGLKIKFGGLI